MDGACHHLFAGAAFAEQGAGDGSGGDFFELTANLEQLWIIGEKAFQRFLLRQADAAVVVLGGSGFASGSGFGSSADGCDSGVGLTSATGFDVLAAVGGGGV